ETTKRAHEEAEASTMFFFRSISQALKKAADGAGRQTAEAREGRAQRLSDLTYEEVLREQAIIGSPEDVAEQINALRDPIGFSSFAGRVNPGGPIPHARGTTRLRPFADVP